MDPYNKLYEFVQFIVHIPSGISNSGKDDGFWIGTSLSLYV